MNKYYVYVCSIKGDPVYVGKGCGDRYKHCTSGRSSCIELNKNLFQHGERAFSVIKVIEGLTEAEALEYERAAIIMGGEGFYNRTLQYKEDRYRASTTPDNRVCDEDKGIYFWYCWAILNNPHYVWDE